MNLQSWHSLRKNTVRRRTRYIWYWCIRHYINSNCIEDVSNMIHRLLSQLFIPFRSFPFLVSFFSVFIAGGQEFDTDVEIANFASSKNFPSSSCGTLMQLGSVQGDTASTIWKYLRDSTSSEDPDWNFTGQYLISKSGKVSVPDDVEKDIAALMKESNLKSEL